MPQKSVIALFYFVFCVLVSLAQQTEIKDLVEQINDLDNVPATISFSSSLSIDGTGGHIQGIQRFIHKGEDYYFLSGSSDEFSYYAVAKSGANNFIVSSNRILPAPYRHAGGIQIYNDLLAVGVEDNIERTKSRVMIFQIEHPEKVSKDPLAIIERVGTYQRATAGCVAITGVNVKIIVAVGDWDSRHLDFYQIDEAELYQEGASLELEFSLELPKHQFSHGPKSAIIHCGICLRLK